MLARLALVSLLAGFGVVESVFARPASRSEALDSDITVPKQNLASTTLGVCPPEIKLKIMQAADEIDMARFLEVTHEMRGLALGDNCLRSVMSKFRLNWVAQIKDEFQNLSDADKAFLPEVFRFDYDLSQGYKPADAPLDSDVLSISANYVNNFHPDTEKALQGYVAGEMARAATELHTIDFRALSLHQKYSFSPLLALAWEGNMDTVVGLRERLVTYSQEPDFMRSLIQYRQQHRLDVYDASRREGSGTDRVPLALQPPEDNFSTTDLAIILTLASAGHFDQLQHYTKLLHPPSSPVVPVVQPQAEDPEGGELNNQMAAAQEQPLLAQDNQAGEGQAGAGGAAEEYQGDMEFATLAYLATVELKGTLADNEFYNRVDIRQRLLMDAWNCAAKYKLSDHTVRYIRTELEALFRGAVTSPPNANECYNNFFGDNVVYDFATGDLGFRVDPGLLNPIESTPKGVSQRHFHHLPSRESIKVIDEGDDEVYRKSAGHFTQSEVQDVVDKLALSKHLRKTNAVISEPSIDLASAFKGKIKQSEFSMMMESHKASMRSRGRGSFGESSKMAAPSDDEDNSDGSTDVGSMNSESHSAFPLSEGDSVYRNTLDDEHSVTGSEVAFSLSDFGDHDTASTLNDESEDDDDNDDDLDARMAELERQNSSLLQELEHNFGLVPAGAAPMESDDEPEDLPADVKEQLAALESKHSSLVEETKSLFSDVPSNDDLMATGQAFLQAQANRGEQSTASTEDAASLDMQVPTNAAMSGNRLSNDPSDWEAVLRAHEAAYRKRQGRNRVQASQGEQSTAPTENAASLDMQVPTDAASEDTEDAVSGNHLSNDLSEWQAVFRTHEAAYRKRQGRSRVQASQGEQSTASTENAASLDMQVPTDAASEDTEDAVSGDHFSNDSSEWQAMLRAHEAAYRKRQGRSRAQQSDDGPSDS
ncbi:hypothetical protein IWQ60_005325 [Tieghemiomyces parasiticus]|uniref:F-box domain-containing protein n=1 Tax=Tieghemiomyces parasiticus TaxID=78921 RepID=A0A9W8ABY9_9FUNG|nr:hypothetical protein IWQ60_005325 [Tieghemiomyces parasiticus]